MSKIFLISAYKNNIRVNLTQGNHRSYYERWLLLIRKGNPTILRYNYFKGHEDWEGYNQSNVRDAYRSPKLG